MAYCEDLETEDDSAKLVSTAEHCAHHYDRCQPLDETAPTPSSQTDYVTGATSLSSKDCQVYVGSKLPSSIEEHHLSKHFSEFHSEILKIELCRNKATNASKGFGFVTFSSRRVAFRAAQKLNHSKLCELYSLRVALAKDTRRPNPPNPYCSLKVTCLPPSVNEPKLRQHFKNAGEIAGCSIKASGPQCAFVIFSHPKAARRAVAMLNQTKLNGWTIFVRWKPNMGEASAPGRRHRQSQPPQQPTHSVKVTNLHPTVTESTLYQHFQQTGGIIKCNIQRSQSLCAHVNFTQPKAAILAVDMLNATELDGRKINVKLTCQYLNIPDRTMMQTLVHIFPTLDGELSQKHDITVSGYQESSSSIHFAGPPLAIISAHKEVTSLLHQYRDYELSLPAPLSPQLLASAHKRLKEQKTRVYLQPPVHPDLMYHLFSFSELGIEEARAILLVMPFQAQLSVSPVTITRLLQYRDGNWFDKLSSDFCVKIDTGKFLIFICGFDEANVQHVHKVLSDLVNEQSRSVTEHQLSCSPVEAQYINHFFSHSPKAFHPCIVCSSKDAKSVYVSGLPCEIQTAEEKIKAELLADLQHRTFQIIHSSMPLLQQAILGEYKHRIIFIKTSSSHALLPGKSGSKSAYTDRIVSLTVSTNNATLFEEVCTALESFTLDTKKVPLHPKAAEHAISFTRMYEMSSGIKVHPENAAIFVEELDESWKRIKKHTGSTLEEIKSSRIEVSVDQAKYLHGMKDLTSMLEKECQMFLLPSLKKWSEKEETRSIIIKGTPQQVESVKQKLDDISTERFDITCEVKCLKIWIKGWEALKVEQEKRQDSEVRIFFQNKAGPKAGAVVIVSFSVLGLDLDQVREVKETILQMRPIEALVSVSPAAIARLSQHRERNMFEKLSNDFCVKVDINNNSIIIWGFDHADVQHVCTTLSALVKEHSVIEKQLSCSLEEAQYIDRFLSQATKDSKAFLRSLPCKVRPSRDAKSIYLSGSQEAIQKAEEKVKAELLSGLQHRTFIFTRSFMPLIHLSILNKYKGRAVFIETGGNTSPTSPTQPAGQGGSKPAYIDNTVSITMYTSDAAVFGEVCIALESLDPTTRRVPLHHACDLETEGDSAKLVSTAEHCAHLHDSFKPLDKQLSKHFSKRDSGAGIPVNDLNPVPTPSSHTDVVTDATSPSSHTDFVTGAVTLSAKTCKVYVGSNLPSSVKECHLSVHFREFEAEILKIELCRDKATNISKGFGFLTFSSEEVALRAVQKLNHSKIFKKISLKVALAEDSCQPNPPNPYCSLKVTCLPPSVTEAKLRLHFISAGKIAQCSIISPYALVFFSHRRAALHAVAKLNQTELDGCTIFVQLKSETGEASAPGLGESQPHQQPTCAVKVTNLSPTVTESSLCQHFQQAGGWIISVKLMCQYLNIPDRMMQALVHIFPALDGELSQKHDITVSGYQESSSSIHFAGPPLAIISAHKEVTSLLHQYRDYILSLPALISPQLLASAHKRLKEQQLQVYLQPPVHPDLMYRLSSFSEAKIEEARAILLARLFEVQLSASPVTIAQLSQHRDGNIFDKLSGNFCVKIDTGRISITISGFDEGDVQYVHTTLSDLVNEHSRSVTEKQFSCSQEEAQYIDHFLSRSPKAFHPCIVHSSRDAKSVYLSGFPGDIQTAEEKIKAKLLNDLQHRTFEITRSSMPLLQQAILREYKGGVVFIETETHSSLAHLPGKSGSKPGYTDHIVSLTVSTNNAALFGEVCTTLELFTMVHPENAVSFTRTYEASSRVKVHPEEAAIFVEELVESCMQIKKHVSSTLEENQSHIQVNVHQIKYLLDKKDFTSTLEKECRMFRLPPLKKWRNIEETRSIVVKGTQQQVESVKQKLADISIEQFNVTCKVQFLKMWIKRWEALKVEQERRQTEVAIFFQGKAEPKSGSVVTVFFAVLGSDPDQVREVKQMILTKENGQTHLHKEFPLTTSAISTLLRALKQNEINPEETFIVKMDIDRDVPKVTFTSPMNAADDLDATEGMIQELLHRYMNTTRDVVIKDPVMGLILASSSFSRHLTNTIRIAKLHEASLDFLKKSKYYIMHLTGGKEALDKAVRRIHSKILNVIAASVGEVVVSVDAKYTAMFCTTEFSCFNYRELQDKLCVVGKFPQSRSTTKVLRVSEKRVASSTLSAASSADSELTKTGEQPQHSVVITLRGPRENLRAAEMKLIQYLKRNL